MGRIAADGTVTHFALPTVGSVPIYIAAGPDGNIWFTELAADKLGRLEFLDAATAAQRPRPLLKKTKLPEAPRKIRPHPEVCG